LHFLIKYNIRVKLILDLKLNSRNSLHIFLIKENKIKLDDEGHNKG